MTTAGKIIQFYQTLTPPQKLPEHVEILNPYKDVKALELATQFYQKYYNDSSERIILFGINPGRFGGGITGVPFTDPKQLVEVCGIENDFEKRAELSSTFIYEMIASCGGPEVFYRKYYFSAVSPLGFILDNKNLNYYDIEGYKTLFTKHVVSCIRTQLKFPCSGEIAYCIGQGQNLQFLKEVNDKYGFFKKIMPLPHPRWVMQYRLKRKDEFIIEYKQKLGF
ncbi:MAG: DUF4918 family protein [Marinoscillum sp.]